MPFDAITPERELQVKRIMNDNIRLTLDDTAMTSVMKMAGGNPGALRICSEILKRGGEIDPQGLAGFGALMCLDSLGIYESRIWLLYKDVCRQDLVKTMACLRAWQLGILPERELLSAISGDARIDTDAILVAVKVRLSNFGGLEEPPPIPPPIAVMPPSPSPMPGDGERVINLD